MDELTLKTHRDLDVWIKIDKDGDLMIESDDSEDFRQLVYIRAADLPQLRDWLNAKLSDSAGVKA